MSIVEYVAFHSSLKQAATEETISAMECDNELSNNKHTDSTEGTAACYRISNLVHPDRNHQSRRSNAAFRQMADEHEVFQLNCRSKSSRQYRVERFVEGATRR